MVRKKNMTEFNIWIVEDNINFRRSIFNLINETDGIKCSNAFGSCEDALDTLKKSNAKPEVILLDLGLPGMGGIKGIELFKKISPETHILIITVYDDNDKVFDAICAGASGYLLKDSTPQKIITSIEEVLSGGAPMSMQIAHKVLEMFSQLKTKENKYGLTEREKEILQLMTTGLTKQQIADKIFLSFHTVNAHIRNIYSKLHVNTISGAISKAYKEHLL